MELNSIKGKFETVLSKAKDTVTETTQKLSEKKMLKIKDIVLKPKFEKLLAYGRIRSYKNDGIHERRRL